MGKVTISAVVPVLDGKHQLELSLPPLIEAVRNGQLLEVLVADDGSSDGSGEFAASLGAKVIKTNQRASGPSRARNLASAKATGDVLLFVDADVVVQGNAIEQLLEAFADPEVGSVYGSYDDQPADRGYASLYMNLRHHFGHRNFGDDVHTFWAGLGAIRRDAFEKVSGYDADAFPYPSVEDIDLGRRLREAGARIRRDPRIQGKHLKRWTWRGVVHTDIFRRAAPWSRLMRLYPDAFGDLNVSRTEQLKAVLAAAFACLTVLLPTPFVPLWSWPIALLLIACANATLLGVFRRSGGVVFAFVGLLFHQFHLIYSATTFVCCNLRPLPKQTAS